jgi:hypothetical protein
MKCGSRDLSKSVPYRNNSLRTGTISAILLFGVTVANAAPLAPATSFVVVQAGRSASDNLFRSKTLPEPQHDAFPEGDSWVNTDHTRSAWAAYGSASVTFAGDSFGTLDASAHVSATGEYAYGYATGGGQFRGNFIVGTIATPPFVSAIPLEFRATGSGSISGTGDGLGGSGSTGIVDATAAVVGVSGFPYNNFQLSFQGSSFRGSFPPEDQPIGLFSVDANAPYTVIMAVTAAAYADAGTFPGQSASSTATAKVDPTISFDQAAFDLQ